MTCFPHVLPAEPVLGGLRTGSGSFPRWILSAVRVCFPPLCRILLMLNRLCARRFIRLGFGWQVHKVSAAEEAACMPKRIKKPVSRKIVLGAIHHLVLIRTETSPEPDRGSAVPTSLRIARTGCRYD